MSSLSRIVPSVAPRCPFPGAGHTPRQTACFAKLPAPQVPHSEHRPAEPVGRGLTALYHLSSCAHAPYQTNPIPFPDTPSCRSPGVTSSKWTVPFHLSKPAPSMLRLRRGAVAASFPHAPPIAKAVNPAVRVFGIAAGGLNVRGEGGTIHSPQADIRRLIASATAWLLNRSRTALCPYSALRFASSGHSITVASKAAR